MNLKYFSIKDYEEIGTFLMRVKFEVGTLDLSIKSISPIMGKGVQTLTLVSGINGDVVKLEVPMTMIDELKEPFRTVSFNGTAKPKITIRRDDGLDDIGDVFE